MATTKVNCLMRSGSPTPNRSGSPATKRSSGPATKPKQPRLTLTQERKKLDFEGKFKTFPYGHQLDCDSGLCKASIIYKDDDYDRPNIQRVRPISDLLKDNYRKRLDKLWTKIAKQDWEEEVSEKDKDFPLFCLHDVDKSDKDILNRGTYYVDDYFLQFIRQYNQTVPEAVQYLLSELPYYVRLDGEEHKYRDEQEVHNHLMAIFNRIGPKMYKAVEEVPAPIGFKDNDEEYVDVEVLDSIIEEITPTVPKDDYLALQLDYATEMTEDNDENTCKPFEQFVHEVCDGKEATLSELVEGWIVADEVREILHEIRGEDADMTKKLAYIFIQETDRTWHQPKKWCHLKQVTKLTDTETTFLSLLMSDNRFEILTLEECDPNTDNEDIMDYHLAMATQKALTDKFFKHQTDDEFIWEWVKAHFQVYGPINLPVSYIEYGKRNRKIKRQRITRPLLKRHVRAINDTQAQNIVFNALELDPQNDTVTTTEEKGDETTTITTENVALRENRDESTAQPMEVVPFGASNFGVRGVTFPELSQRFNNLGTFTWTTNHTQGQIIKVFHLPIDLTTLMINNPATLPMLQYLFFRPQLTLRFQLNTTRFHQGLLAIGVMYYSRLSNNIQTNREPTNAAQVIQLDFALCDGSSSNIAELKIPYQSHLHMLPIAKGEVGSSQYYCSVYVSVLAPLRTGVDNQQSVSVTSFASLSCDSVDTEFFGLVPRQVILEPQGFISGVFSNASTVLKGASEVGGLIAKVVRPIENLFTGEGQKHKATNMDKPTNPTESDKFIPLDTVHLSYGEGVLQTRTLRLNPATITPHKPDLIPNTGTILDVGQISRKWGYLTSFSISKETAPTTILTSIPITPFASFKISNSTPPILLPTPLTGVASMYTYWTGQLEYRFIIVKAQAHSLRLRFTALPIQAKDSTILQSGYSVIEDFEERSEVVISPPYFGSTNLTPVLFDNEAVVLGSLTVSLESDLITMNSVSSTVDVVVMMRASPSLELTVPKATIFRPIADQNPHLFSVRILNNNDSTLYKSLVLRFKLFNNDIPQEFEVETGESFVENFVIEEVDWITITRNTDSYRPGQAGKILCESQLPKLVVTITNGLVLQEQTISGLTYYYCDFYFIKQYKATTLKYYVNEPEQLEPQNDERENAMQQFNLSTNQVSNPSGDLLGEHFPLRTALRRFQPILTTNTQLTAGKTKQLIFDVNFTTPFLRDSTEIVDNVSWCASSFRFSKGSLNYIILTTQNKPANIKIFVNHVPGGMVSTPHPYLSWEDVDNMTPVDMFSHELVSSNQSTIPFTVPYYNYVKYLINRFDPTEYGRATAAAYSLGSVSISVTSDSDVDLRLRLERSLGDDADMYTFQGWPLVNQEIKNVYWNASEPFAVKNGKVEISQRKPIVQMLEPQNSEVEEERSEPIINNTEDLLKDFRKSKHLQVRRFAKRLQKKLKKYQNKLEPQNDEEVTPAEEGLLAKLKGMAGKACEVAESIFGKISSVIQEFFNCAVRGAVFSASYILKHLGRVILGAISVTKLYMVYFLVKTMIYSPDYWAKGMAFVSFCLELGIVKVGTHTLLLMAVAELLFLGRPTGFVRLVPQDGGISEETTTKCKSLAALFFAGIAAAAGFKSAPTYTKGISEFIRLFALVGSGWFNFLNGVGKLIIDYVFYLVGYENPEAVAISKLKELNLDMEAWVTKVLDLTNPENHDKVLASTELREEVSKAYEKGNYLLNTINATKDNNLKFSFNIIFKQLSELFKETGFVPNSITANISPIVVWLDGPAGCGKSQFAETLGIKLASLLGIQYCGKPTWVLNPARKYMDGYNGQPIIILDDALQVGGQEAETQFLQHWFGLVTNAPYSAEFSAISEKKKFVTPSVVIVCANAAYPKPNVKCEVAFWRRRDFVLRCEMNKEYLKRYVKEGESDIKNLNDGRIPGFDDDFSHMKFAFYNCPFESQAPDSFTTENWKTYLDVLQRIGKESINLYRRRCEAAKKNIDLSRDLLPEVIEKTRDDLVAKLDIDDITKEISKKLSLGDFSLPMDPQGNEVVDVETTVYYDPNDADDEEESEELKCKREFLDEIVKTEPVYTEVGMLTKTGQKWAQMSDEDIAKLIANYGETDNNEMCPLSCAQWVKYNRFKRVNMSLHLMNTFVSPFMSSAKYCSCGTAIVKSSEVEILLLPCVKYESDAGCGACARALQVVQTCVKSTMGIPMAGVPELEKLYCPPIRQPKLRMQNWMQVNLKPITDWWKLKVKSLWDFLDAKKYTLLAVGAFVLAMCGLYKTMSGIGSMFSSVKDMFGKNDGDEAAASIISKVISPIIPQLASSGDVRTAKAKVKSVRVMAQNGCLPERLYRNRVFLVVDYENTTSKTIYGLGIRGRYIIVPAHVFSYGTITGLRIQTFGQHEVGGIVDLDLSGFEYININNTDLALLHVINRRMPEFRNIMGSLLNGKELSRVSTDGVLVEADHSRRSGMKIHHFQIKQTALVARYRDEKSFNLLGFSYPLERKGLCGSVLYDDRSQRIIGLHTSGSAGTGYASIVCSDFFTGFPFVGSEDIDEPELEEGGLIEAHGEFIPLGKILDDQACHMVTKTKITESVCHNSIGPAVRIPVDMSSKGDRYPAQAKLRVALEKGFKPTLPFPKRMMDEAQMDILNMFLAKARPSTLVVSRRPISEAVCGLPGVPFMESLKLNTSPGYPLTSMRRGSKKSDFIITENQGGEQKLVSMHKLAYELYQQNHKVRLGGVVPFSPYQNFLKDERLKPGKNPRLVNGASLDTTLEFRRYTMDFVSAMQNNNLECQVAVGINIHGPEWSTLVNRLLSMGDKFGCGDYSGFGPGLDPELVLRSGEIINAWYERHCPNVSKDDQEVRRILFEELAFSKEVSVDTVIQTLCGSPSGNPLTVVVNSIVNLFYIRLAWLSHFDGTELASLTRFREHILPVVYGDDIIFTMSPEISEVFNNKTISEELAKYKITYTDADKSGHVRPYCDISDATLLKCFIRPHPNRGKSFYLACLDKTMIEDVPNWIRLPAPDKEEASMENCVETCRLAYAWGIDYHNQVRSQLTEFWASRGKQLVTEEWDYLDAMYFGDLKSLGPKELQKADLRPTWYQHQVGLQGGSISISGVSVQAEPNATTLEEQAEASTTTVKDGNALNRVLSLLPTW